jgi:hypothetical protein
LKISMSAPSKNNKIIVSLRQCHSKKKNTLFYICSFFLFLTTKCRGLNWDDFFVFWPPNSKKWRFVQNLVQHSPIVLFWITRCNLELASVLFIQGGDVRTNKAYICVRGRHSQRELDFQLTWKRKTGWTRLPYSKNLRLPRYTLSTY